MNKYDLVTFKINCTWEAEKRSQLHYGDTKRDSGACYNKAEFFSILAIITKDQILVSKRGGFATNLHKNVIKCVKTRFNKKAF